MSNQTEAELKVVAVITLNRILELTPNDPHIVSTLKKLEWDIIKHYNLKPNESVVVTLKGSDYIVERNDFDKLTITPTSTSL